jgi:hypothetical protein
MKALSTIILSLVYGITFSQTTFQEVYGGLRADYGESIVQLNNGDYIMCGVQVYQDSTSNFIGEGVVRRLDGNGNELWTLNYNDPNSPHQGLTFSNIIVTTDNNLVLTGISDYGFQNNYYDYFLTKMDTNGNVIWSNNYGGAHRQWSKKVIETSDGGFLMVGYNEFSGSAQSMSMYAIKTDINGDFEWDYLHPDTSDAIRHQAYSVIEDDQGDFIISGSINQILHNSTDFYVVKIDADGEFLWDQVIDHAVGGQGRDVFIKTNGNILVCGWYAPNYCAKPLIIELSSGGTFLSENEFNYDMNCEWAYSFDKDKSDNIIMLSFDSEYNYRVTKIDNSSTILWSSFINYNQATSAQGNSIIQTLDDGFICTGTSVIQGNIESLAFKGGKDGTMSADNLVSLLNEFKIYPNPARNILNISIPSNYEILRMELLDLKGNFIKKLQVDEMQLDISAIPDGLYFLNLEFENETVTKKILIK